MAAVAAVHSLGQEGAHGLVQMQRFCESNDALPEHVKQS